MSSINSKNTKSTTTTATVFPDFSSFLASACSAITTKTSVAPLERVKILKQSQSYYSQHNYTSIFNSFRFIWQNEGIKGFYRGNYSNVTRIIPAYMIKFPLNDFYKKQLKASKENPGRLLASGVLAGISQITVTYPLDIMRTRMSLDHYMTSNYNNYITCARNILVNEGFRGFYKGFNSSLLTYPIYVGLQFSIYGYFKDDYPYLAGGIAGITAQTLAYPGDTIKRQLQLNGLDNTQKKYNGLWDCVRSMYRQYGIRGYYVGLGVNLIKAVPEATIQFAVYEYLKEHLPKYI